MILFGLDPSMSNTAIVAMSYPEMKVLDRLLITTEKASTKKKVRASSDTIARAREIYEEAHRFVNGHKHEVDALLLAAETPSGSQSASGMKSYGLSCAIIGTFPGAFEVTPEEVKLASVGTKTASKAEMIAWAMDLHPELEWYMRGGKQVAGKNEHLADAVAVIYAAMKTPEFQRIKHLI